MLASLALVAALASGQVQPVVEAESQPQEAYAGRANAVAPASAGLTLDAETRANPNERVCRSSARSTFSRIGPSRTCRTRAEWARLEGESRRIIDRQQNEGASRLGMPSVTVP